MRINAKKTVELICEQCQKQFSRSKKEHTRNSNKGRKTFCSISCARRFLNILNPPRGNICNFQGKKKSVNALSPFRWFYRRIVNRQESHGIGTDITVEFLKELWEKQKGICPYTKFEMSLPRGVATKKNNSPLRASLDRIDSSRPYLKDNVEFVCVSVNYAKNGFSKEQMYNFFDSVRKSAKL